MQNKILNTKPTELLELFLADYSSLFNINIEDAKKMIKDNLSYYNGDDITSVSSEMEKKWYEKLKDGIPYYEVYNDDNYYIDIWGCWKTYSRSYLKIINSRGTLIKESLDCSIVEYLSDKSKSVIDLGCGIGYSTASLKELFPKCDVYGFNIIGSRQYEFCEYISKKYNFSMTDDFKRIGQIDIAFASEYFEHFERPIEHLDEIVAYINPKCFIIANSFNTKSIGHFIEYKNQNDIINQKDISRLFNKHLLSLGYKKLNTKIFNSKPNIYIKNES